MVNMIRKALAGFILLSEHKKLPDTPHRPPDTFFRASALRGLSEKNTKPRLLLIKGHDEAEVLRNLRSIIIENEAAPTKGMPSEGLNLVLFRGVFGSGGHDINPTKIAWENGEIKIECEFERPGEGICTTASFTQPTLIVPLNPLPAGKYSARVQVQEVIRGSKGPANDGAVKAWQSLSFRVSN